MWQWRVSSKDVATQIMEPKYVEVLDPPALAALFNVQAARRSDSFDTCCREVGRLLRCLKEQTSGE
jgi:hypothetical protein